MKIKYEKQSDKEIVYKCIVFIFWVIITKCLPIAFSVITEAFPKEMTTSLIFLTGVFYFIISFFSITWIITCMIECLED